MYYNINIYIYTHIHYNDIMYSLRKVSLFYLLLHVSLYFYIVIHMGSSGPYIISKKCIFMVFFFEILFVCF